MKKLQFLVFVAALVLASSLAAVSAASPRSGNLHVTKECSKYSGAAGGFCTITSSNLNSIKAGSRVVYASAAGDQDARLPRQRPRHRRAGQQHRLRARRPQSLDPHRRGHVLGRNRHVHALPHRPDRGRMPRPAQLFLGWAVQLQSAQLTNPLRGPDAGAPQRGVPASTSRSTSTRYGSAAGTAPNPRARVRFLSGHSLCRIGSRLKQRRWLSQVQALGAWPDAVEGR